MNGLGPLFRYFRAEKHAGLFCLVFGLIALLVSGWLWRADETFRAMAVPVALVALLQIAIGGVLAWRTDRQVNDLVAGLENNPAQAKAAELERMSRVYASFRLVEAAELILIVTGLVLALSLRARPAIMAVGMGVLLQATVMLVFDLFAEYRAHLYASWLQKLPG
jgi:hypothetical protein